MRAQLPPGQTPDWVTVSDFAWAPDGASAAVTVSYRTAATPIDSRLIHIRLNAAPESK